MEVKEISKKDAQTLISQYHYLGEKAFLYCKAYGLYEDDVLIGACVFSPVTGIVSLKSWFGLGNDLGKGIYELIRLVLVPEFNGKNYGSYLVGRSLRLLKQTGARGVISLADSTIHVGYIYQSTNFKYYGTTDKKSDFYRWDGKINARGSTKNERGVWLERSVKYRYFYQFDKKLLPIVPEQKFPKDRGNQIICCNGTLKVYDKRFNELFTCPKCTDNFILI